VNSKIKILLVDDEPDIIEILSYSLENAGYTIFKAFDGLEAIKIAKQEIPDLIILDLMIPKMNGIEACEIIRKTKSLENVLITFLSARAEDLTKITALDSGADDYITKPIRPKVLLSKINSLFRRKNNSDNKNIIEIENLTVDKNKYIVINKGIEIYLPRKEFELLYLLVSSPNTVLTRNNILELVWGKDVIVGDRTIDVHIRKLREKIGESYFKTVKGVGYKFVS
jgi:two-component system alkaline phosphatase synthesis response regulator PhoP